MEYKIDFICATSEETKKLGVLFASNSFVKEVITLKGQLGAGKTTFSQGFAKGLNIQGIINSPTFNIVKPYFHGTIPFYHIDAYRLEDTNQDLGLEEYIDGDGVSLVEWAEFIKELIPFERFDIEITILEEEKRKVTVTCYDDKYFKVLKKVEELWNIH